MKKRILLFIISFFVSASTFAQVTGTVVDASTKEPLIGAVIISTANPSIGTVAGIDGSFSINLKVGDEVSVSFVGYEGQVIKTQSSNSIALSQASSELNEIVVTSSVIDIAKSRETPIAVSSISPIEIELKVGNQEFPEIMNRTPGVYATKQGGGYGDSRISLRGFDQRNTSFLINGQPVNDMENGWVYWSNWQGLTDVASGIQLQRGLGASRLAVPSVGGTVSIFTKAAEKVKGGSIAQVIGNNGYSKTSVVYNSGLNDKGWATSFLISQWSGNGYVYNTSGQGTTYFAAIGYAPKDSKHALNLTILGAGQWHHQRDAWVSIRDYENFGEEGIDVRWNTNGGTLNGKEFSMRKNFYNKPLATFNWDWNISKNVKLATSLYASAGRGGGTGPRGGNFRASATDMYPFNIDLTQHYLENGRGSRNPDGSINFDAVIAHNQGVGAYTGAISNFKGQKIGSNGFRNDGVSREVMIRRASMNSHDWVGAISTLDFNTDKMRYSVGIDLRNYKGYHYRVLSDLMGLDGYYSTGNRNSAGQIINTLVNPSPFLNTGIRGPKIDYYNIGLVGWQGLNTLVEYKTNNVFSAVLQAGLSNQSFKRVDYFDQPKLPESVKKNVGGGYLKGGANYNYNEHSNVFFNAGLISRQPNFDGVFPNFANNVNPDLQNEKISSFEFGYGYITSLFRLNINAYTTTWGNRFISRGFTVANGQDGTAQFKNIDQVHNGLEVEASYKASNSLKFNGMLSLGDWRYTKDFKATVFDQNNNQIGEGTLYTNNAKIGDAAQTTAFFGADYKVGAFNFDLGYRFVDGLYADYSITNSDFLSPNNKGALKLPSYGLVDLGSTVRFKIGGANATFRVNINNLLNTLYIMESNSNIHAEAGADTWKGIDKTNFVWFGFRRTWNASLKINF